MRTTPWPSLFLPFWLSAISSHLGNQMEIREKLVQRKDLLCFNCKPFLPASPHSEHLARQQHGSYCFQLEILQSSRASIRHPPSQRHSNSQAMVPSETSQPRLQGVSSPILQVSMSTASPSLVCLHLNGSPLTFQPVSNCETNYPTLN